jgi:transcriptional regulator with XRE-family HTH domain
MALRDVVWGAGLSLREVNRRLNKSPSFLNQVLSGRIRLNIETIVEVLEVVGMSPRDFWTELGTTKEEEPIEVARPRRRGQYWTRSGTSDDQPVSRGELREVVWQVIDRLESSGKLSRDAVENILEGVVRGETAAK